MDWHKLQHKLYEMDPTDPREDFEKLRNSVNSNTKKEEVDLINESYEVAPNSLPLNVTSIEDFAALAGIRLDEKQLKGPAGQARGSDPMPAAIKNRTQHPLKDKLVGEDFVDSFKTGFRNYNRLPSLGFGKKFQKPSTYRPTTSKSSYDVNNLARLLKINNIDEFLQAINNAGNTNFSQTDAQILGQAFRNLLLLHYTRKEEAFKELTNLRPSTFKPVATTKPMSDSKIADHSKIEIKEYLLRLLDEKKLK
jgi:hypothetical protein